jgi:hypothetical protein
MSQRECAGFNWPPLVVCASDPVSISPEAVNRAGPESITKSFRSFDRFGFVARFAWPPPEPSEDCGVGQLASHAVRPSKAFTGTFAQNGPSL